MRRIITPILLLMAIIAWADMPKYLTLYTEGKTESYLISDIRKITFGTQSENSLEVHCKNKSNIDSYVYSDIEKIFFEVEPSGVEDVMVDNDNLSITYNKSSQEITISSSQEIATVVVYNLNGIVVEMLSPNATDAIISLADYPSGLYVVKTITATESKTHKIVKH